MWLQIYCIVSLYSNATFNEIWYWNALACFKMYVTGERVTQSLFSYDRAKYVTS